jgi:hypothetical protein
VPEPVLGQHCVGLRRVDQPAQQVRDLAPGVPRLVVLDAPLEAVEQKLRCARLGDQLVDGLPVARLEVAAEQRVLPLDHDAASELVDERGQAQQPRVLEQHLAPAAGHRHDLDPGPEARLERTRGQQREGTLAVAEHGGSAPQQGPVEIGVDAAERHGVSAVTEAARG